MIGRRGFLLGAGAVLIAPFDSRAAAPPPGTMAAADVHVDGYPTVEAVRWIGRELNQATQGRLDIRVYFAGQLGRETDTVNLARFGAVAMTRVNMAALTNAFPLCRVLCLPYVFDDVAHMRRALDADVGRRILAGFAQRDVIGLAFYDSGARCFYNVHRPIHEPRDLHGLKLRVPPSDIFMGMMQAFGANPTPLPYGEVFSALQTHLIDGAENNFPAFIASRQFEVARHWSQSEHSYSPEALLMSRRHLEAMTADDRALLEDLATRSVTYMRTLWDATEAKARETAITSGVKLDEVDRAAFTRIAAPFNETYFVDEELRGLYRAIRDLGNGA